MATFYKFQNGELADADQVNTVVQTLNRANALGTALFNYRVNNVTLTQGISQTQYALGNHSYLFPNSTQYTLRNITGSIISGSSSIIPLSTTPFIDFAPPYDEFTTGSFPLGTKAGSYTATYNSSTSSSVSMSNTYGSSSIYLTSSAGGASSHGSALGSVIFNGSSPILITYPGSNLELGIETLLNVTASAAGDGDPSNSACYVELRNPATGSTVELYSLGVSAQYNSTGNGTQYYGDLTTKSLTKLIYNGATGSFLLRNLYYKTGYYYHDTADTPLNTSYNDWLLNDSQSTLTTGSWYLTFRTYAYRYDGASSGAHIYVKRITKFTGSETGSNYFVWGPFGQKDNYSVISGVTEGFSRIPGSLNVYYGRSSSVFESTANTTRMTTSVGSEVYIKVVGTYTGSLDTTTVNTPFFSGIVVTHDGEANKW